MTDDIPGRLLDWYQENKRDLPWRRTRDPYRVWVSEVMLQQTQVVTVAPYFERFVARYPDVASLAAADLQDVLKAWEKMGYYARARNLHAAARTLVRENEGVVPCDHEAFRRLPGVGAYIAAAVMSIAFGEPHAVLDGNVKRVLSRLFMIGEPVNSSAAMKSLRARADALIDRGRPGEFNQALMELGATLCRPRNPDCGRCPLVDHCQAFHAGRVGDFPAPRPRREVPLHHIALGVVRKDGRILITRRKEEGHLGGLWEFPGGKVAEGESSEETCRREIREECGLDVRVTDFLAHVDHAYSHFRISVDVYTCEYRAGQVILNGPTDHRWILVDEIDDYPFPGANHKFIPLVREKLSAPPGSGVPAGSPSGSPAKVVSVNARAARAVPARPEPRGRPRRC